MTTDTLHQTADNVAKPSLFCFETDTFAFANETVWNYVNGTVQPAAAPEKGKPLYTRRCFVVSRATVQFWKFARFDSAATPLPEKELARRIRQVAARSVWKSPLSPEEKIVLTGYRNLREISTAHAGVFQAHMGLGWPIYFRIGNFPIVIPMTARDKARINAEMLADLDVGVPTILWLYNFPKLDINHAVVVYAAERSENQIRYRVYDPNYTDAPKTLEFDPVTNQFIYQPTFYYKGGPVTARPVYRGYFE